MPAVLRVIGPEFLNRQGVPTTPKALIQTCDICGAANAPFIIKAGDSPSRVYCGWRDGQPYCKGKS